MQDGVIKIIINVDKTENGLKVALEMSDGKTEKPCIDTFRLNVGSPYAAKLLGGRVKVAVMEEFTRRFLNS